MPGTGGGAGREFGTGGVSLLGTGLVGTASRGTITPAAGTGGTESLAIGIGPDIAGPDIVGPDIFMAGAKVVTCPVGIPLNGADGEYELWLDG